MSYVEEMQARRAAEASERERAARAKAVTPAGKLAAAVRRITEALERGRRAFREIGDELRGIRDGRLYQATHATFEDFCQESLQFSRQHVNHLIAGADVLASLETTVSKTFPLPATEREARPLAALPPTERAEAWTEAVQTAPPSGVTAAHVEAVVHAKRPAKAPKAPTKTPCPVCGCTRLHH